MSTRKYRCPQCHQKTGVDILYGLPSYDPELLEERGEIVLGGCCIDLDAPERHCTTCGHEWRIRRRIPPLLLSL